MNRRAFVTGAAAFSVSVTTFTPARAQIYPAGMIRVVVPSAAGTPPDIMGRLVAAELAEREGWRGHR